jgi:hypothetical protein
MTTDKAIVKVSVRMVCRETKAFFVTTSILCELRQFLCGATHRLRAIGAPADNVIFGRVSQRGAEPPGSELKRSVFLASRCRGFERKH